VERALRNFDFNITSRCNSFNRFNDPLSIRAHLRPLLSAKDHYGNFSIFKILLILQIFVRRQNHLEPRGFRSRQQIAILECSPALLGGGADFVFNEISAKW